MTCNAHWPLSHTNTHQLLSNTGRPFWCHCDGIPPLPFVSTRHRGSDVCYLGATRPLNLLPISYKSPKKDVHLTLLIQSFIFKCVSELAIFPIPWLTMLLVGALAAIYLSSLWRVGGLWMAMPWIYTGDLTIIHPRSFQIGSLLKVNCAS